MYATIPPMNSRNTKIKSALNSHARAIVPYEFLSIFMLAVVRN